MISATRRQTLMGALAVPAFAGMPSLAWAGTGGALLLYDPSLESGRRLAATHDGKALAIEGDRIRFARAAFARRPALVLGVSRSADALLIEEVSREAGYAPVSEEEAKALRDIIIGGRDKGGAVGWLLAPKV